MSLIDQLLKAKGLTKQELARLLGVPYHSLIKTLKPTPYYTKAGEKRYRECRYIREAIAAWLGYPYERVWGPNSAALLKNLIKEEIILQTAADKYRLEVQKQEKLQALGL